MITMTATEAARRFASLLDAIERDGEMVLIERHGRPVAQVGPAPGLSGRAVKDLLGKPRDREWGAELTELRALLVDRGPTWND